MRLESVSAELCASIVILGPTFYRCAWKGQEMSQFFYLPVNVRTAKHVRQHLFAWPEDSAGDLLFCGTCSVPVVFWSPGSGLFAKRRTYMIWKFWCYWAL